MSSTPQEVEWFDLTLSRLMTHQIPPPMQSVRKLSLILSGEKTLRTKRLTELLNQPIIYVKQKGNVAQITQRAGNNCEEAKRFLDAFYGVLEDALVSGEVVQLIQGRVFLPYARFQVIIDLITIQNSPLIFLPRNLLFSRQARTLKKKSID